MRLVRLSDGCYVNPDDVQELTVNSHSNSLTVRMRNGVGHSVGFDYGKTIYDTLRRLKAELEGASFQTGGSMTINRYTAWPEMGPFDAYYVELRDDPDGKLVLFDEVAHWLSPEAPLEVGKAPIVAFARRHSEAPDLAVDSARTIIRGLANIAERNAEEIEFWKSDAERQTLLLRKATAALIMVRDADNDCRLDGLQTIPPGPRAAIDAAILDAGADKE